jgi:hypothetical protein
MAAFPQELAARNVAQAAVQQRPPGLTVRGTPEGLTMERRLGFPWLEQRLLRLGM